MTTATIDMNVLHAANKCASTEESQYYLKGVCIEFHESEIIYIATDGHALFGYRQIDSEHTLRGTYIIPSNIIKAVKLNKKYPMVTLERIECGNERCKLKLIPMGGPEFVFDTIDGVFPAWRHVVPDACEPIMAAYDPTILAQLWAAGKLIGSEKPTLMQNGTSPALLTYDNSNAFGLIMPITGGTLATRPPSWIRGYSATVEKVAA